MSGRVNRRNYYRVLHVQHDAPAAVITSSYRALMRTLEIHPDRGGDHWNAALVNEAYRVLSDPATRERVETTIEGEPTTDTFEALMARAAENAST